MRINCVITLYANIYVIKEINVSILDRMIYCLTDFIVADMLLDIFLFKEFRRGVSGFMRQSLLQNL